MSDNERRIAEIKKRVEDTTCDTYSTRGRTREGRISEEDARYLFASHASWRILAEQNGKLANLSVSETEAALSKALDDTTAELLAAQDEIERHRNRNLN